MQELVVIGGPVVVSTLAAFGIAQTKSLWAGRRQQSVRRRRLVLALHLVNASIVLLLLRWTVGG